MKSRMAITIGCAGSGVACGSQDRSYFPRTIVPVLHDEGGAVVLDGPQRREAAGIVLGHLPLRKRRAQGRLRQAKFAPALR